MGMLLDLQKYMLAVLLKIVPGFRRKGIDLNYFYKGFIILIFNPD
jgi:hypothetical protein